MNQRYPDCRHVTTGNRRLAAGPASYLRRLPTDLWQPRRGRRGHERASQRCRPDPSQTEATWVRVPRLLDSSAAVNVRAS